MRAGGISPYRGPEARARSTDNGENGGNLQTIVYTGSASPPRRAGRTACGSQLSLAATISRYSAAYRAAGRRHDTSAAIALRCRAVHTS